MNKASKTQQGEVISPKDATYRSGAAARLSGVPVETLRVWERRYGVTEPDRSELGQRQYSFEDVRRLGLIKQLVDAGNAIGAVAKLDVEQLLSMLGVAATLPAQQGQVVQAPPSLLRVALVGHQLRHTLINLNQQQSNLSLVQTATNLHQAAVQLKDVMVDVLIIEQSEITEPRQQIELIRQAQLACHAKVALVLYRFASSDAIRQLRQASCHVARIPADTLEVESLCRVSLQREEARQTHQVQKISLRQRDQFAKRQAKLPERLIDDDTLALIARSATTIHCECPRHLVDLLQMLTSFERYSAQCENKNEDDASLHRDLHHTAAHARASLEQALLRVAQAEGIAF
jgi:DNA-binding transcriptional MerR regulator